MTPHSLTHTDGDLTQFADSPSPMEKHAMPELARQTTAITLSTEQFEKLYLTPLMGRQSRLSRQLGNPTPLALGSFALTTTPLSCCLMGWRGASGSGIAFTGPMFFLGGSMLVLSAVLEFVLGNTFPCAVFGTVGGFWLSFGATLVPSFNAAAPYSTSTHDTMEGLGSPEFMATYAFLFMSMDILMVMFMICATRTNAVFLTVFALLVPTFAFLAAAYWRLAVGDVLVGNRLVVGAGAVLFVVSMLGFYLFLAQLLDSMGFPVQLPVGDLTPLWSSWTKKRSDSEDTEAGDAGNDN